MRFFKYLVFLVLSIISINAFAALTYKIGNSSSSTMQGVCESYADEIRTSTFYFKYSASQASTDTAFYCVYSKWNVSNNSFHSNANNFTGGVITTVDSCPSSVSSNPISVPNWDKWTLDQSDAYYSKNVTGKTACYQGCRYKDPSMGGTPPEMHLTYGSPVKDSSCPPDGTTKPSTPVPDGTPPQPPTQCKNAQGSDAYCDKPPTGCPSGYKSGSFNNKEICVKNSPDPDPTKPNPNDPNNGDGKGSCNGTNNCNTTNFDDSKIISAIDSLKSSFNSAISTMTNTLSSAISSVTSAVNSVTSAVNASADKVKTAVDANTAATNSVKSSVDANTAATNSVKSSVDANTAATNSVKSSVDANTAATNSVKTSVDANTAAVNANADKIKGSVDANTAATNSVKTSVDANTAAVNANGDKVKTAVDANTTAVNANGDKIKGAVDANTDAVKEGNTLLDDIKKWLSDSDGVSAEDGLITVDKFEFQNQPDKFQWSAQCPAPIQTDTSIIGYSWTYSFSFDNWCAVLAKLSNYFVFAATFGACLIIAGVRNG